MTPLLQFARIFPDHRLQVISKEELRYRFNSVDCARIYERVANRMILKKGLPITAHVETWESSGIVREIAMVVEPVPEEYTFRDEVQDDEHHEEEKAEWL